MGMATDLEAAAAADPYDDMETNTHHAASYGRRRGCSAAFYPSVGNEGCFTLVWTGVTMAVSFVVISAITATLYLTYRPPSFAVDLTGYEGIDPARAGRLVSPAFNVTIRMNNTCVDSADVAVMYSGVALGWARVEPRDCEEGRWGKDVEVVARGGGVGLSQRLRDRMASDWRSGVLELDVDLKKYYAGRRTDTEIPRSMIVCKVTMMDKNQGPSLMLGEDK
ncbi:hypothetical protein ACP70R_038407 [Stipagrostis hirtigluma subsp. patula]